MQNFNVSLRPSTSEPSQKADLATRFGQLLTYGIGFFGKYFLFVGVPLSLVAFLDRRVVLDPTFNAITRRSRLSAFSWALILSTMYGVAQAVRGVMLGYDSRTVLEILVYNFCPWFIFLGIRTGITRPAFLRQYITFLAWFGAILTPLYFIALRHVHLTIGDEDLIQPGTGSLVLIGLFCFYRNLGRFWFPILVCSFQTIATQIRADWLGLALVLLVWGVATKRLRQVLSIAAVMFVLIVVGFIADVRLPGVPGRGGEISARETIGRAISGIDPELAQEYSSNSQTYAGTIQWREKWWRAIREEVSEHTSTLLLGMGYGYPISNLVPYLKGKDIRSPHSIFYFNLAYGGLLGFALFAFLQLSFLSLLWTTYRETGQIFGFLTLLYLLVGAFFGNFFEAPQSSIPMYLMLGMCVGPLLAKRSDGQKSSPYLRPLFLDVRSRPTPACAAGFR